MCLCVTDWSHARGKPRRLHPRCCDQWDGGESLQQTQVRTEHACWCLSSGSASSEGPGLCLWRRVLQRPVVKCDGRASGAFPGCVTRCFTLTSWFLPARPTKVTIYVTRCRHFLSFFLLFRVRKEFDGYSSYRKCVCVCVCVCVCSVVIHLHCVCGELISDTGGVTVNIQVTVPRDVGLPCGIYLRLISPCAAWKQTDQSSFSITTLIFTATQFIYLQKCLGIIYKVLMLLF